MAAKNTTAATPSNVFDDVIAKAQEQFLASVEQTQTLALDSYKALLDGVAKMDIPTIPGLTELSEIRDDLFDQAYEFTATLLDSQRTFTKKILDTASAQR